MVEDRNKLKPYIDYGDGTHAIFRHIKEIIVTEAGGVEEPYYEFYLRPTIKARIKWNVKESDPDFVNKGEWAGFYKVKYKKDYCECLDPSPDSAVWLLSCDYKGNFIDLYGGEKTMWLEKIKTLRKQNEVLRASKNSLAFEMTKMMKDPIGYMKKFGKHMKGLLDDVGAPYAIPPAPPGGGTQ